MARILDKNAVMIFGLVSSLALRVLEGKWPAVVNCSKSLWTALNAHAFGYDEISITEREIESSLRIRFLNETEGFEGLVGRHGKPRHAPVYPDGKIEAHPILQVRGRLH